jgi:hypothetical protein
MLLIKENFVKIWPGIFWEMGGGAGQDLAPGAREARTAPFMYNIVFIFFLKSNNLY